MPAGRPEMYESHVKPHLAVIRSWRAKGATQEQIAERLKVNHDSFCKYKQKYSELADALKNGLDESVAAVEGALHKSAMKGNIAAQIFYLKNRKPDEWRDKTEVDVTGTLGIEQIQQRLAEGTKKFTTNLQDG